MTTHYIGFGGHKMSTMELRPGLTIKCHVLPNTGWLNWRRFLQPRWWLSKMLWPLVACTVNLEIEET